MNVKVKLLDLERAREMLHNEEDVRYMLGMLESTLGSEIRQLGSLLEAGNVKGANAILHPLKGFLPMFCVDALSREVIEIEKLSKSATADEVRPLYARLRPRLEQLDAEVKAWLAR